MPTQQQQPKPFTPGFKLAFDEFTRFAKTNPKKLAAEHRELSPEKRLAKLKQMFNLFDLIPGAAAPGAVPKMTEFLAGLNETIEDPNLTKKLEEIRILATDDLKLVELKKLFKDSKIVEASANYWNTYISSQYRDKEGEMRSMFDANSRDAGESISHVNSQGDYDPEKKIIRDLMRLLYELFDVVLIQSGYPAVFAPDSKNQGAGRWDPQKGILYS